MRPCRVALVIALLLATPPKARAQSGEWVEVDRREALTGGRTADDTRRDALYAALAEAVRRIAGVRVQGSVVATRSDSAGRVVDHYTEVVRLDATGRATAWRIVRDGWTTERPRGSESRAVYELTLRVCVERERGLPDPAFTVTLAANAGAYAVRGAGPAASDEVIATVVTSLDAALTLVSIVDDSVFVLAPNAVMPVVRTAARRPFEVPDAELRGMGLHFRAWLPAGAPARTEFLAVVATRRPVAIPSAPGLGAARDTGTLTLAEFNQWLVGLPMDERAVAQVPLQVRRLP
jgi:hypothetical protein